MVKEETAKVAEKKVPDVPKKKTEGAPAPEGKVKETKPKVVKTGAKYTMLKNYDPAGSEKMPLQCKQILGILNDAPDKTLNKKDLLEKMTTIVQTRQPIDRILAFYQPRLLSGKYISMEAIIAPVAAPAEAPKA